MFTVVSESLSCDSLCHLLLLISKVMGAWSFERENEVADLEEEEEMYEETMASDSNGYKLGVVMC